MSSIPMFPRLYQQLAHRAPHGGYHLEELNHFLPSWIAATESMISHGPFQDGCRVLLIGYLHWWIDHVTALGLLLAGAGHSVALGYIPFGRWSERIQPFDTQRQEAILEDTFRPMRHLIQPLNLRQQSNRQLPPEVLDQVHKQSIFDLQYTLQKEHIAYETDPTDRDLYRLRFERNLIVTRSILDLIEDNAFDVLVIPNGSILEFGMIFRLVKQEGRRVVTFDFGEQRSRLWLAQDAEVMRQDTSALWAIRGDDPLIPDEEEALEVLYQARRDGKVWSTFARQWQAGERQGKHGLQSALGIDLEKPLVLVCTNVVGDSLALGRQIFTEGMADWLEMTVHHFAQREDVQLVIRVHPGELLGAGYPSTEIVHNAMDNLPEHIIVVPPDSPVNTYDLIAQASLGLVYTTTVGLEMAMSGLPVIVSGRTHYREKGFTLDPMSMEEYLSLLAVPEMPQLTPDQIRRAMHYAYVFFFEYPFPYPWHLIGFWDDIDNMPFEAVATPEGIQPYLSTFEALLGNEIQWDWVANPSHKEAS